MVLHAEYRPVAMWDPDPAACRAAGALAPDARTAGLFAVTAMPAENLDGTDLAAVDLLVLADAGAPGRRLAGVLGPWLEAGGALLALVGDPGQEQDLRIGVLPLLDLPGQVRWVARGEDQAERVRVLDPAHPVFADLGQEALNALSAARWSRYFAVDEGDAAVLLQADGGAPLLIEGRRGRGWWELAPWHLRADATDVMLNPVFLPMMQRLAARLVVGGGRVATLTVGAAGPDSPTGPDRYGYLAYDNEDPAPEAPVYDWIEIDHDPSLDLTGSMTISFWLKSDADSGGRMVNSPHLSRGLAPH